MARSSARGGPIVAAAILMAAATTGAEAQTDLTAGKSPAQLFSTDCSACHRSPQGLARGRDPYAIAYFLRDHYTTKPANAGAIAAYLASVRSAPQPRPPAAVPGQEQAAAAPAGEVGSARAQAPRPIERLANATVERLKALAASADAAKPSEPGAPERGPALIAGYAAAGVAAESLRSAALAAIPAPGRAPAADQPAETTAGAAERSPTSAAASPGPPAGSALPSAQSNDDAP